MGCKSSCKVCGLVYLQGSWGSDCPECVRWANASTKEDDRIRRALRAIVKLYEKHGRGDVAYDTALWNAYDAVVRETGVRLPKKEIKHFER